MLGYHRRFTVLAVGAVLSPGCRTDNTNYVEVHTANGTACALGADHYLRCWGAAATDAPADRDVPGLAPHRCAFVLGALVAVLAGCAPDLTKPATGGTAHEHPYDDGHRYSWVTMHDLSVAAIDEAGAIHTWEQEGYDFPELPAERAYVRIDGRYDALCGLDVEGVLVCSSEHDGMRVVNPDGPGAVSWTVDVEGRALWVGADGHLRWEHGTQDEPPEDLTVAGGAVQVVGLLDDSLDHLFACARLDTGVIACWGGGRLAGSAPVPAGISDWISMDGGSTCVVRPSGAVECLGLEGEYCDPSGAWEPAGTFSTVETFDRRCAIRTDGSLLCEEDYGKYCPAPVGAVGQVAPGRDQDCWVSEDGMLACAYRVLDPLCDPAGCDWGHPQALQEIWPSVDGGGR